MKTEYGRECHTQGYEKEQRMREVAVGSLSR